ncbi:MAG: ADP-L-glycero-D-manno-heptose 6-epimerase [bacterium]|nr:MAG: ADP-L-glycero-D-manno-heptose 6-epimerase [bacterium]KAF0148248.1 MAG: ADP-L-glycero-D-manno-heptose 6-epimerase [bacterium]KAF0167743.1 MAG: ADP-L-glycero-D-manno-heptose 6-epimerase [bacterium]TXT20128.1 MAG: ADP-L-glycero-D-manno-heptose 6-epimerase [bacterium]
MIIITGGAGMIGSMIAWHFNAHSQRDDLVLVDRILEADQWQNYCRRDIVEYLDKDELFPWLEARPNLKVEAVIHMGAISATTERDFGLLLETNIRYSQRLWQWCADKGVAYLYASSAATYGGGELGYVDSHDNDALRPLNGYGFSKQFFDRWALRQAREGKPTPPFWYGFKFFNVYGPNEYHKGRMASVVYHTFNQTRASGGMKLFRSHRPDYADGMQMRDFVYVKDAAAVLVHFVERRPASGLYNIGTGKARAFLDLARATQRSMGLEPAIEFIDMPEDLRGKYQYFTQADMAKLRAAGYDKPFTELEDGVHDYVSGYLLKDDPYC